MKITKMRGDRRVLDREERERHPGERRDRLQHLDERVERAVARAATCRSGSRAGPRPARPAEARAPRAAANRRAGCRCPCRSGRCRRTDRRGASSDGLAHLRERREAGGLRRRRRSLPSSFCVLDLLGRRPGSRFAAAGSVATCHTPSRTTQHRQPTAATICSFDRTIGVIASDLPDREAAAYSVGLGRVEGLAHDLELLVGVRRRRLRRAPSSASCASVSRNTCSAIPCSRRRP